MNPNAALITDHELLIRTQLRDALARLHGPILGGEPLAQALGYRNGAALRQARRRGHVSLKFFMLPNRRGWYALTDDVADWLAHARAAADAATERQDSSY